MYLSTIVTIAGIVFIVATNVSLRKGPVKATDVHNL